MDSPGFHAPTHQYGVCFPADTGHLLSSVPGAENLVVRDEQGNPVWEGVTGIGIEDWAGEGFTGRDEESTT